MLNDGGLRCESSRDEERLRQQCLWRVASEIAANYWKWGNCSHRAILFFSLERGIIIRSEQMAAKWHMSVSAGFHYDQRLRKTTTMTSLVLSFMSLYCLRILCSLHNIFRLDAHREEGLDYIRLYFKDFYCISFDNGLHLRLLPPITAATCSSSFRGFRTCRCFSRRCCRCGR